MASAPYYSEFEHRSPPAPVPHSEWRQALFQILAVVFMVFGVAYLRWRWTASLNLDALWFAVPLVAAETLSFLGSVLMLIAAWANRDPERRNAVRMLSDMRPLLPGETDRPIAIDVYIATLNEDKDLVRLTVRDAKRMTYPHPDVDLRIHVLDDGRRDGRDPGKEDFKRMAMEEGVGYFTREDNEGYKAGNLNNAFLRTSGDILVILDADTRPFPTFLHHTTGHFRDARMAWVQTPQWFYDLLPAIGMDAYIARQFPWMHRLLPGFVRSALSRIKTGADILGNDPQLFYDVLLRRRNLHNAAFCCGAGSLHRRDALLDHARKQQRAEMARRTERVPAKSSRKPETAKQETSASKVPLRPFAYHASEDIYTSLLLHADREKRWRSCLHPTVECRMLSPQDLNAWVKQRTRYATGAIDIGLGRHSPLWLPGLGLGQRLSYFSTIYSYFAPLWLLVFLLSPAIFFFTLTPPVMAFNFDFFKYFIPFIALNNIVSMLCNWGITTRRSEQYYVASFWLFLRSLWTVVKGRTVAFNVTSKRRGIGSSVRHAWPHWSIIAITLAGVAYNGVLIMNNTHPSFSGFVANCVWGGYNIYQLNAYVRAAHWRNA